MKKTSLLMKCLLILLLPIGMLLNYTSSLNSTITERIYSNISYKWFSQTISTVTGVFPFSVAELMLIAFVLFIIWRLVVLCVRFVKGTENRWEIFKKGIINGLALAGVIYFSFIIMWGLNYNRMMVSQIFELDVRPASVKELAALCEDLITRANDLRSRVHEDTKGVMGSPKGLRDVLNRAHKGYDRASQVHAELGGQYGVPKGIFLSQLMAYTGIAGVYSFYTSEANVNTTTPASLLPTTVCHEMAHQRGFAREDEANYIAYFTCSMHPDDDFRYSGVFLALIHSMNALYENDREAYNTLRVDYGEGIKRDLRAISEYNALYEGPVEQNFSKANDLYLKANNQKDGEMSYGRVVDLLIAEYRTKQEKPTK
ncbi:DUF3810 domain-containing protein [Petroclostridium sp. X23]|uniref:DUF3810 domain-containing protein n=1 Tax=Petroclostridium sp. X23 TaxID=3045146 RepID=UPI0024AE31CA|nr:DUF3810 domain-containing protein [Petroclostridium sp. X23]WHH60321.1 DUF3810 domain-containing protein [Petroclostridium sp. X23]